jgi:hypothetical protein
LLLIKLTLVAKDVPVLVLVLTIHQYADRQMDRKTETVDEMGSVDMRYSVIEQVVQQVPMMIQLQQR